MIAVYHGMDDLGGPGTVLLVLTAIVVGLFVVGRWLAGRGRW